MTRRTIKAGTLGLIILGLLIAQAILAFVWPGPQLREWRTAETVREVT